MATIKHILFPFDFSQEAVLAAPFVRALGHRLEARITLISVIPPWDDAPLGLPSIVEADAEQLECDLKSRLERVLINELSDARVERVAVSGDPALTITDFAHAKAVDMIMMPTHGCGFFRSLLIGSVTAKVLHDAKCPVWTATHVKEHQLREVPRNILCAVDGSSRTPALMQWAAEFSQQIGTSLTLLYVVPPINDWLASPSERNLQEQVREQASARIDSLRRSAGVDFPFRIAVGRVADTVAKEARQDGADLVIIGRGSLQSTLGRLGAEAYGIIKKSPCPVVSV